MTPPWFAGQIASGAGRASEERQVTLYLPVADDRVPGAELLPLNLCVVVDVVAFGRLAQCLAQYVVGDQFVGRVQQRRRQRLDTARGDLLGRQDMQVVAVRLARVETAVDAVQAGGQLDRQGQVGVGRAVAAPVLHPVAVRYPQHLGPVVAAVGGVPRGPGGTGCGRSDP